jgi:hypothetical protein
MKIVLVFCILAAASLPLSADEVSRAQVFGGYSANVLRAPASGASIYSGWNASTAYPLKWKVSAVADFAGYYGRENDVVNTSVHTFLLGPSLTLHDGRISPFVHVMFGASRLRADSGGPVLTRNAFTIAAGGGVDLRISHRWAVRMVQFDYVRQRFFNEVPHGGRLSAGVVFRFGE